MKISVVQLDIDWGNPRENIRRAEALIDGQDADLYVLPEMWSTGYAVDPKEVAESEKASSALQWMQHNGLAPFVVVWLLWMSRSITSIAIIS